MTRAIYFLRFPSSLSLPIAQPCDDLLSLSRLCLACLSRYPLPCSFSPRSFASCSFSDRFPLSRFSLSLSLLIYIASCLAIAPLPVFSSHSSRFLYPCRSRFSKAAPQPQSVAALHVPLSCPCVFGNYSCCSPLLGRSQAWFQHHDKDEHEGKGGGSAILCGCSGSVPLPCLSNHIAHNS